MVINIFLKIVPYLLLFLFVFFEFAPSYLTDKEIIKPYFTFMFLYALINNDAEKFRPFWILLFGLFYDFLDGEIIGITSVFFLITLHFLRRKHSTIISIDFKVIWVNFILILLTYVFFNKLTLYIFFDEILEIKRLLLSLILSILLFPFFNSIVKKFITNLGFYNE